MSTESAMLSNHLILCCPLLHLPSIFSASGSFPMSQLFASGGQSVGASVSMLTMNIWGWFPLGLTCLISLQSKELKNLLQHNWNASILWCLAFFYDPTLTSVHDYWNDLLKAAQFEVVVQFRFYTEIIFNMRYVFLYGCFFRLLIQKVVNWYLLCVFQLFYLASRK